MVKPEDIDPAMVIKMTWRHSRFSDGSASSVLFIRMADGLCHCIEHEPAAGTDAVAIERHVMAGRSAVGLHP